MLVPTHVEPLWGVWWWRIVTSWKLVVRFYIYLYRQIFVVIFSPLVPAPIAVTVTAPPGVIAGASVNLTCTVVLSPAVDVPVTVNTEWTGPNVMFMPTDPVPAVMVNTTTYVSTVSVGAARTGSYSCQTNITSGGATSGSTDITFGTYVIVCLYLAY